MKIYITGPAGSGKSTIAHQLGKKFGIPVTHLDELLWNPDWTENKEYLELQARAIAQSDWIIEGPSCSIIKSMQDVDRIIILDYPPIGNIGRLLLRRLKSIFGIARLGIILPDRLSIDFLQRTYTWRKRQLPRLIENIEISGLQGRVFHLTSPQDAIEKILLVSK